MICQVDIDDGVRFSLLLGEQVIYFGGHQHLFLIFLLGDIFLIEVDNEMLVVLAI